MTKRPETWREWPNRPWLRGWFLLPLILYLFAYLFPIRIFVAVARLGSPLISLSEVLSVWMGSLKKIEILVAQGCIRTDFLKNMSRVSQSKLNLRNLPDLILLSSIETTSTSGTVVTVSKIRVSVAPYASIPLIESLLYVFKFR